MSKVAIKGASTGTGTFTIESPATNTDRTFVLPDASGDIAVFATGTKMLFQQTAAPTGWTKDTTHDNKALRVVSGTAGSGGSVAFTTAFASQAVSGSVGNTTLTQAQMPSHAHAGQYPTGSGAQAYGGMDNIVRGFSTTLGGSNVPTLSQGSSNAHNHSFSGTAINLAVQYVDLIIATKA
jgi:hypothetical protein